MGYGKQALIMGCHMHPQIPILVPLTLEDLYCLEQTHIHQHGCMHPSKDHLMSMVWKVGGEGNPVKGSQAPLLCDATLKMHCLQVLHHTLNTSNVYHMDDISTKVNFLDPDWEVTTSDLVHEMAEEYRKRHMNIPQNIITKLSSYQMSLGNAAHENYAIIDYWVSEALHQLCLPMIVAGGFAAHHLGHVTHCNDVDIFAYVPPWFDPFTLQWRFGPCFPNVHDGRHVPQGLGWLKSCQSTDQP